MPSKSDQMRQGLPPGTPPMSSAQSGLGWLNEHQVAEWLSMSVSKLRQDRHKRRGLPYSKFGRSVRYAVEDIRTHMRGNRIDPTAVG